MENQKLRNLCQGCCCHGVLFVLRLIHPSPEKKEGISRIEIRLAHNVSKVRISMEKILLPKFWLFWIFSVGHVLSNNAKEILSAQLGSLRHPGLLIRHYQFSEPPEPCHVLRGPRS